MAAPYRAEFANWAAHGALISLVNLLSLPSSHGFVPRRAGELTLLATDVKRLDMLKRELSSAEPAVVKGYLLGVKALVFEIGFMLHQDPTLHRNEVFFADWERASNLAAQAETAEDAAHMRNLAYKLSIMLPFWEDPARLAERNATAERWFQSTETRALR